MIDNKYFILDKEKYYEDLMMGRLHLEDYEYICPLCKGHSIGFIFSKCPRCNNKGKIDWVDKIKRGI